jgi:dTDP-4-dehydrorhamnose 3,5-epimerase-like enzyme
VTLDDVRWFDFQDAGDERGLLTVVEGARHVPFPIARVFYIHGVPGGAVRGGHTHRLTDQVAVAVHGRLRIALSDGERIETHTLDRPDRGLYLPRHVFAWLYDFSADAVCLVLASLPYDRAQTIRTWDEFLAFRALSPRPEPDPRTIAEGRRVAVAPAAALPR